MSVDDVAQISIEDLEDVGLYKLGHQKRFLLAIKRIKDLKAGKRCPQFPAVGTPKMTPHTMGPAYQANEFRAQPQINQVNLQSKLNECHTSFPFPYETMLLIHS
jgi:hypothetical protein